MNVKDVKKTNIMVILSAIALLFCLILSLYKPLAVYMTLLLMGGLTIYNMNRIEHIYITAKEVKEDGQTSDGTAQQD